MTRKCDRNGCEQQADVLVEFGDSGETRCYCARDYNELKTFHYLDLSIRRRL